MPDRPAANPRAPDALERVPVDSRAEWRAWLARHHAASPGVWLVLWKQGSGRPRVPYDAVEAARADGSWTRIDAAQALEAPPDLAAALAADADAARHWAAFPPSARKGILE